MEARRQGKEEYEIVPNKGMYYIIIFWACSNKNMSHSNAMWHPRRQRIPTQ
jgi:hypothetical protein